MSSIASRLWSPLRNRRRGETTLSSDPTSLLQTVDELSAGGEYLAAVDLLMSSEVTARSLECQKTLLEMRWAAYRWQRDSLGTKTLPLDGAVADPFPGLDGVPEILARDLDAEILRGSIQHHGCLLIRGLLSGDRALTMLSDVRAGFAEKDEWRGAVFRWLAHERSVDPDPDPEIPASLGGVDFSELPADLREWESAHFRVFNPLAKSGFIKVPGDRLARTDGLAIADSPRLGYSIAKAFDDQGLTALAARFFGERPAFVVPKASASRVQPGALGLGWHQDKPVFDQSFRPDSRWLNFWVALSPAGRNAPTLSVIPKRIESVLSPGADVGSLRISYRLLSDLACGVNPAVLAFDPGDALLFDEYLVHTTFAPPKMKEVRYNIEFWMTGTSGLGVDGGPMIL